MTLLHTEIGGLDCVKLLHYFHVRGDVPFGFISVALHFVTCDNSGGKWKFISVKKCYFMLGVRHRNILVKMNF